MTVAAAAVFHFIAEGQMHILFRVISGFLCQFRVFLISQTMLCRIPVQCHHLFDGFRRSQSFVFSGKTICELIIVVAVVIINRIAVHGSHILRIRHPPAVAGQVEHDDAGKESRQHSQDPQREKILLREDSNGAGEDDFHDDEGKQQPHRHTHQQHGSAVQRVVKEESEDGHAYEDDEPGDDLFKQTVHHGIANPFQPCPFVSQSCQNQQDQTDGQIGQGQRHRHGIAVPHFRQQVQQRIGPGHEILHAFRHGIESIQETFTVAEHQPENQRHDAEEYPGQQYLHDAASHQASSQHEEAVEEGEDGNGIASPVQGCGRHAGDE